MILVCLSFTKARVRPKKLQGAIMELKPKYKRIVLKLSGEALAGEKGFGLDEKIIAGVVDQIIRIHEMGVEVGIVLGGGNFWRGRQGTHMDRTTADHMGTVSYTHLTLPTT